MAVNPVKDLAEFRAMVTPVYDQFRDRIGSALLDSLLAAVKK